MGRKWIVITAPKFFPDEEKENLEAWMKDMDRAWQSKDGYTVYSRVLNTGKLVLEHAVIIRNDAEPVTWLDKQKIKNEIFGESCEAVEIYPRGYENSYSADFCHLWLFPNDYRIPFGLNQRHCKVENRNRRRNPVGFIAEMARIMGIV